MDRVDGADGVPCRLRPGPGRLRSTPSSARTGAILGQSHPICGGRSRGFPFWPGGLPGLAPGAYSTRPGLPRAGGLAIWPGAPGAKKKSVLDLPTTVHYRLTSAGTRPYLMYDFRAITIISFNTIKAYIYRYYI